LNSGNLTWEIDVFEGKLAGLIIAEIELPSEDFEIDIPSWVGEEVTSDPSYLNAELFKKL
jgi:CYTH domain-containing protein